MGPFYLEVEMNRKMKMSIAKADRKQQNIDAGVMSARFPEVASIVISMKYRQVGVLEPFQRVVNYFPGSYAVFKVNCLNEGCLEGGFDFSKIIAAMVRDLKNVSKGELSCTGCGTEADFSHVAYEITIRYA
jgi:hypothetical protein